MDNLERIEVLRETAHLPEKELKALLAGLGAEEEEALFAAARGVRERYYGKDVYLRGLIEFTNYCRNDCYYCGIRRGNLTLARYRLTQEEILQCCGEGYRLGFRTFVLQGGEDPFWDDARVCALVRAVKKRWPDCAVTLSIGEREKESYEAFRAAGADRYLLRQETASEEHYRFLHPGEMSWAHRRQCLHDLKAAGFQTGCGFMAGSPGQTLDNIVEDLYYMQEFGPHMVGIGPFVPHAATRFRDEPAGTLEQTLRLLAVVRLMIPEVLLPATTALGSIHPRGRELGLMAGANVVMPNISPQATRDKYLLYDGKVGTALTPDEGVADLIRRIDSTGYRAVVSRGDHREQADIGREISREG